MTNYREYFKNMSIISGSEIFLIVFAVIKNKFIAYSLGPEGLGMYGLLTSFFTFIGVFTGSWIATAATKYVSEYNSKNELWNVQFITSTSVIIPATLTFIVSAILILGREFTIKYFLSEEITDMYFIFFSLAFISRTLNPIIGSILQGLKQVKPYALLKTGSVIIEVTIIIVFIYLYDMLGFFAGIFISSIFTSFIYYKILMKKVPISIKSISFKDTPTIRLLKFGKVSFFLSIFYLFAQYFQRKIILTEFDIKEAGLLHGGLLIMNYLTLFGRSLSFNYFPEISETNNDNNKKHIIMKFLKISLFINVPIILFFILINSTIIELLLSSKFIGIQSSLPIFALAALLQNVGFGFHYAILGLEKLKLHSFLTISSSIILILFPYYYANSIGITSVAYSYCISSVMSSCIQYIFLVRMKIL